MSLVRLTVLSVWVVGVIASLLPLPLGAADEKPSAKQKSEAIRPTQVIKLFNGRDLNGLTTWLEDARHEDPRKVFSVQDGMLQVSGDGWGYIRTNQPYRDYHLVVEFKLGEKTWGKREGRARDSGILVHCVGPDGGRGGVWMTSIEAQIIEGGCGDFILVNGPGDDGQPVPMTLTCEVDRDRDGEVIWKEGGKRETFDLNNRKRINWYGRDPDWEDKAGFRGQQDVEKPMGQWSRQEVICDGGRITVLVNGVKVNEGFDAYPREGKILLQTEGAEITFRRWELWPLGKAPAFDKGE